MASERRVEQVNILLREVLAGILERELQFGAGVMVTVTRVSASEDLNYAHVFVSVLGGGDEGEVRVVGELAQNIGMIQHAVNRKLRMRPVPRVSFEIDQDEKRRERIEELLAKSERPEIEK